MNRSLFVTGFVSCLTLSGINSAHADDFRFVRPGDPDRIFHQTEAIAIQLPPNLNQAELNGLFVELDGTDITQMVSVQNGQVVFYPSSPYNAGSHALRLVKLGRNGKLVEINRWNFTVSGAPPVESASSVSGSVDATYSYMPWEDDHPDDRLDRHNGSAQMRIQGATQVERWQFSARGNGFANTDDNFNPAGSNIEVGEYLLSAERPSDDVSALFRLGHHDIGANNLLMNQFYRRGASATLDIDQHTVTLTGFAQNPAPTVGNANITGITEGNQRVQGVRATLRPVASLSDKLEFEGTAYEGEGVLSKSSNSAIVSHLSGVTTTSVIEEKNAGSGYQLGFRSTLMENYLALHSQYARANFDADGRHAGVGAEDGHAKRIAFLITPLGSEVTEDGRLRRWNLEAAYQRAGTFFQSLMNPLLETDRETYALTSSYLYGGYTLDGQLAWATNNTDDLTGIPTERSLNGWVQGSYAPEETIFGQPVFFLGGMFNDEGRWKTPAGYTGLDLNRTSTSVNGGASLSFDKSVWSILHTYARMVDSVTRTNEYYSHYTDLTVEFKAADWWTLRPGLQAEFLDEKIDGSSSSYHISLGSDLIFIPDKFWNNTSLSALLNRDHTPAGDDYNAQTEFTWLLKPVEVNSPGYAVTLAGAYDDLNDITTLPGGQQKNKDARVFLRLKVSAPFAY